MMLRLIWRNLWRNSRRTLITTASIAFAVLLAVLMQSFQNGIFNNLIKNVVGYYSGYVQIHQNGYWDERVLDNSFSWSDALADTLRQNPHVRQVVPRLETFMLASMGTTTKGCMLIGTDVEAESRLTQLKGKITQGSYLQPGEDAVLVAEGLADRLGLTTNDTLVLFGQGYHGMLAAGKYRIRGIIQLKSPAMNASFVYTSLAAAQYLLSADDRLTSVSLGIDRPENRAIIVDNLRSSLGQDYEVMSWEEMMPEIANHIKADGFSFYIFSGILYLLIGFGFFGTILMMTAERTYEFGMLTAIGMKKNKLQGILLGEAVLITLLGTTAGILLSLPMVVWLNKNPLRFTGEIARVYEQFGFEAIFPTAVEAHIFYIQALIVLSIALLVGLYPLWYVKRLDPVKAMRK